MKLKSKETKISYLATYFPTSGRPVEMEVELEAAGTVTFDGKTWAVTPNSSWTDKKGQRRLILPEGLATTFDGATVSGKSIMTARNFFLFVKMNLMEQLYKLQNTKPWFKQSATWIIAGSVAIVALILVWIAIEVGGGMSNLQEAISGFQFPEGSATPSGSEGHNQLEPR